jgi:hypothetical protein
MTKTEAQIYSARRLGLGYASAASGLIVIGPPVIWHQPQPPRSFWALSPFGFG